MTTPIFQCVGMVAHDLPATLNFYRRLGLDIPADADHAPHVDIEVASGVWLMWDTAETIRAMNPQWAPAEGGTSLAFHCHNPAGVDQTYATMTGHGYESVFAPFDADWGQRYATLRDPDGNHADLFAPLTS